MVYALLGGNVRARKIIFIACSREAEQRARRLAKLLDDAGFKAAPWWDVTVLGKHAFEQLSEQSRTVDGAVFLAMKDDKTWYRSIETDTPRDNVILEFGLFASILGLNRSIILAEPGVKLPSDLEGVTFAAGGADHEFDSSVRRIVSHFQTSFQDEATSAQQKPLMVVCDPQLARYQVEGRPRAWNMRAIYLGTEGARAWLGIARDPGYQTDKDRRALLKNARKLLIAKGAFRTYVSLGPGDGKLDKGLATTLLELEPTIQCIPVDLSDGLLWIASHELADRIRVPIGLLADFEDNLAFVTANVRRHGKPPYLYGMLGNTLGNLDGDELQFLRELRRDLTPDDGILLDIAVRKRSVKQTAPDISSWSDDVRAFYAHGAALRCGVSTTEILDDFDSRIAAQVEESDHPANGTLLRTFTVDGKRFAQVRHYDLEELEKELQDIGFDVVCERVQSDKLYDSAILRLQKQSGD